MTIDVISNANTATVTTGGTDAPAAGTEETFLVNTTSDWDNLPGDGEIMRVMAVTDLGKLSGYEIIGIVGPVTNGTGVAWPAIRSVEGPAPHTNLANFLIMPVETPGGLDGRYAQATAVVNDQSGVSDSYTLDWADGDFADITMSANTAFTLANLVPGRSVLLVLRGSYTPTWTTSITWAGGSAPTYADDGSGMEFVFVMTTSGEVRGAAAQGGALLALNNLSDVADAGTSRFNLAGPVLSAVAAAAVANVNISSPGATLDGYTLLTNDEVLLTAQTTASQNGVWTWSGASSALTRPHEFPSAGVVKRGRIVQVANGTDYGNTVWLLKATAAGLTIDTTAQTWTELAAGSISLPLSVANGGFGAGNITTKSSGSTYTTLSTDRVVVITSTSTFTLTVGTSGVATGQPLTVLNETGKVVTISGVSDTAVLGGNDNMDLVYDGSAWQTKSYSGQSKIGQRVAYDAVSAPFTFTPATAWYFTDTTASGTAPSAPVPNDGNVYRAEFRCSYLELASGTGAAIAVGLGTSPTNIYTTQVFPGAVGSEYPVSVVAQDIIGAGQTVVVVCTIGDGGETVTFEAASPPVGGGPVADTAGPAELSIYRVA